MEIRCSYRAIAASRAQLFSSRPHPSDWSLPAADSSSGGGSNPSGSSAPASASAAAAGKGDFGTLKAICGPGNATGGVGRGVTTTSIRIGTTADPGRRRLRVWSRSSSTPPTRSASGATRPAASTAARSSSTSGTRSSSTSGRPSPTPARRTSCSSATATRSTAGREAARGLQARATSPPTTVSPEAATPRAAGLGRPVDPTQYRYGPLRLLITAYPEARRASASAAATSPRWSRTASASRRRCSKNGVKVTALQEKPPSVNNYRPYMEQLKSTGTVGLYEFKGQDIAPGDPGDEGHRLDAAVPLLTCSSTPAVAVQAAKSLGTYPPTYVGFSHLPFELSRPVPGADRRSRTS